VRDYPAPLAATVNIAVVRLTDDGHSDATALLRLGAFLGPEPIPIAWLETARPRLTTIPGDPDDPMWLRSALQHLGRLGLARIDFDTFQIHRLTQAILRTQVSPDLVEVIGEEVTAVLAAFNPGDPQSPADWPMWASFTAHLVTPHVSAAVTGRPELRPTLLEAVHFLLCSGQPRTAHDLGTALNQAWSMDVGLDHPDVLTCAQHLGHASAALGDYVKARSIIEDLLARRRRVLGEDHPDTLQCANNLANTLGDLGEYAESRRMHEDVLVRRGVLGEDHPDTLTSAGNLAGVLRDLGEHAESRRMQEDVLVRRRRVLGEDHPATLTSANNLASVLFKQSQYAEAVELWRDVRARYVRVLGATHPDVVTVTENLAGALTAIGRTYEAQQLTGRKASKGKRRFGRKRR
jgi:tetratricopeptide (TPR) repeat protein